MLSAIAQVKLLGRCVFCAAATPPVSSATPPPQRAHAAWRCLRASAGEGPGITSNCGSITGAATTSERLAAFCPAGCSHGGAGGNYTAGEADYEITRYRRAVLYGNAAAPTTPGSGLRGVGPAYAHLRGGGVLRLEVGAGGATLAAGARLTAAGANSTTRYVGAASGGSVWLSVAGGALASDSTAQISVVGGSAVTDGGGGGGGRIAVYYGNGAWSGKTIKAGGNGDGTGSSGEAGSVVVAA